MLSVFVDLEKTYNYCIRKSDMAERNMRVVQDMYEDSRKVVRCAVGVTNGFRMWGGITSCFCSKPLFVCNGDGQVNRLG